MCIISATNEELHDSLGIEGWGRQQNQPTPKPDPAGPPLIIHRRVLFLWFRCIPIIPSCFYGSLKHSLFSFFNLARKSSSLFHSHVKYVKRIW